MIHKVECYCVECDHCNAPFEDYSGFSIWTDKDIAKEMATDSEWHEDGDKLYCPKCYQIDDDDKLTLREGGER